MTLTLFQLLSWLLCTTPVWSKLPPPRQNRYENLSASPCADGSVSRARIEEREGALYLTRFDCEERSPLRLSLPVPTGRNALETQYLVWEGRLFESAHGKEKSTLLYCRDSSARNVLVLLQKSSQGFWLALSELRDGRSAWTAVAAQKKGDTYFGQGDLAPADFIELKVTGSKVQAGYRFDTGLGKLDARALREGQATVSCRAPFGRGAR